MANRPVRRSRDARLSLTTAAAVLVCVVLAYVQNSAQSLVYVQHANSTNTTSLYTTTGNVTLNYETDVTLSINQNGINPQTVALRGDEAYLYAIDFSGGAINVVDTGSQSIVQHVTLSNHGFAIALSTDGSRLYAAIPGSNQVSVFSADPITGQLTAVTDISLPGGSAPVGLAASPDGSRVYAMAANADAVFVIDATTNTVVGSPIAVGTFPVQGAVSPDGTRLYVTNRDSDTVSVIDTSTNTVIATASTGTSPIGIVVSPDGAHYYTANSDDGTISQFDATTNTQIASDIVANGDPAQVAITADGTVLYAGANNEHLVGYAIQGDGTLVAPVTATPQILGASFALGTNGNALLAAGKTFLARRSEALDTTGADGAHFTGGTLRIEATGESILTAISLDSGGGTIDTNGNDTGIDGVIAGSGSLTKSGAGVLQLFPSNTYTGSTTVDGGTLWARQSLATTAVAVNNGATFGAVSVQGPVTVASGGTLRPRNTLPGLLTTGGLSLSAGSTLDLQLNTLAPPVTRGPDTGALHSDSVGVAGTVTLGGTLSVSVGSAASPGQLFTIIDNDGSDPIGGTFTGLPEGATFTASGQTFRITYAGGDGNDVVLGTVASPTLSTIASSDVALGGSVSDTATIAGGASPTGTITFRLYGPNDGTCAAAPVFTDVKTVTANGSYPSSSFTPASVGVYRWVAGYSGDFTNDPAPGACNDANESVTIVKASPTLQVTASAGVAFGGSITATAALAGGVAPNGTITFRLYGPGPGAATCSIVPVSTTTVSVSGNGSYPSVAVAPPAAGDYRWTAVYAGDAGNNSAATGCLGGATVTIAKADQTITFGPLANKTFGDPPFSVFATGGGSFNPIAFSSLTPSVCTVTGPLVILGGLGTCTIAANQAGNGNYNAAPQVTQSFTVLPNCSAVTIAQTSLPLGFAGIPYSQTLTLSGAAAPVTWSVTGALPAGVAFNAGAFSGTPSARGAFPVTVTGTDANACHASAALVLPISTERRIVSGAGNGIPSTVRAFNLATTVSANFNAYAAAFLGGVSVAQGDTNGDGVPDIITGAGPGGGPHVEVFDGATGAVRLSFFAFDPSFPSGVEVAAGDVNGDGYADVIVVGGCGAPPVARAFDGRTGTLLRDYAIDTFIPSCGFHVASGDTDGDGFADIIIGPGFGAKSFVQVIDGESGLLRGWWIPYGTFNGGVYVAAADVNGDGYADIVTGAGPAGGPHVQVFDGRTGIPIPGPLGGFMAYDAAFDGGVRVAAADLNGDGRAEVITAAGPGGGPHVRVFDGASGNELLSVYAYDAAFTGGVFVGGATTLGRLSIDLASQTGGAVTVAGWALREGAGTVGVDAVHVWALPVGGGGPVFLGATTPGVARADVAALYGGEFYLSGFEVTGSLAPGTYDLVVFARNSVTGLFDQSRVVRITVN